MRIGFDAKRAFLNNTGLGNYSRDTIRILSNHFADNEYLLYTTKKNTNSRLSFILNQVNTLTYSPKSLIDRILTGYWRNKNIVKDLQNHKIEIYHGLSNELPIGIEKTSIKSIVTIHDLIFMRYPHLFKTIDRKIYYYKTKSACLRADKIIAISKQTKQDIIDFLQIPEKKISVVYQGCNTAFQKQYPNDNKKSIKTKFNIPEKYLLYVGTIEERKNLLTLLKAVRELPNQHLVVIGNGGSYKSQCEKFIKNNNLSKRVLFLNNLSIKEIAIIYQSAEIMIYPSIFEGFGIPILEALFAKVPVITSKGSCFAETGGPHSKYVNPLSFSELKETILEIQKSTELQNNMKEKGFIYAQQFTDKNIAINLMNVYSNL